VTGGEALRWPRAEFYAQEASTRIRKITLSDLERIAARRGSVTGREDWLKSKAADYTQAFAVIAGREGASSWRTLVTVVLADGTGGRFMLDMTNGDWLSLKTISRDELVELAHRFLATFPLIPVGASKELSGLELWEEWGRFPNE
jgi:hypothetical protein